MKRRKRLLTKTPLARSHTPMRRTPMRRSTRHAKRKAPRRGFETEAHGRCIASFTGCLGAATERHHRKGRRSNDHTPVNRCDLCHYCHHVVIHAYPQWAYAHGWLVHSWDDPNTVPLLFGCEPGCSCYI